MPSAMKPVTTNDMNAMNHDAVVGPMRDYVAELVKRNQLRVEVAENIALKHQLLVESEGYKAAKLDLERQRTSIAQTAALAEAEGKAHLSTLELKRLRKEISALRQSFEQSEASFGALSQEYSQYRSTADAEIKVLQTENANLLAEREELEPQLQEASSQLTKSQKVCDRLKAELQAIAAEKDALSKAKDVMRKECARLQESLAKQVEALNLCKEDIRKRKESTVKLKEQLAALKELVAAAEGGKKALQREADKVQALESLVAKQRASIQDTREKLVAMKASSDHAANMTREVFDLVDILQREYFRSEHELQQVNVRAERIKHHLSYRLGNVLVTQSKSLRGLLSIPFKLREQHQGYRLYRETLPAPIDNKGEVAQPLVDGGNYCSVRTRWRTMEIAGDGANVELTFTLLSPQANKTISAELMLVDGYGSEFSYTDTNKSIAEQIVGFSLVSDGSTYKINVSAPGSIRIATRKIAGGAAIFKIDVARKHPVKRVSSEARIAAPNAAPLLAGKAPTTSGPSPTPMKSAIIWQAHQMMEKGDAESAIEFARTHAREFVRPAIELLVANARVTNEKEWLKSVNKYLSQFSISPISLADKGVNRFLRLKCDSSSRHTTGPLISVIMPTFNASRTISHALGSILNQSWKNIEVLVVDDASDDDTWSIVQTLAKFDPRIKTFRNARNVGPYVSKNLALQFCKGQYITGHDSDDWAHPDRLAIQISELLASNGHLKGNIARMIRMTPDGSFVHFAKEGKTSDDGVLRDAAISCMFEREYFVKNLGHWDCVRFGADSELISRATKVMQDRFQKTRQMSMICLDNEGSLTNDPVHGVSKVTGISPTRKFYRDQWMAWHQAMQPEQAYLAFPQKDRIFAVPDAAAVPVSDVEENIRAARATL